MKIVVTNIPAFYKINLYNAVNKKEKLFVIFTDGIEDDRNKDFISGNLEFEYEILKGSTLQKAKRAIKIIKSHEHKELILGYWDSIILWILAFMSPRRKNAFIVESSYYESTVFGIKGLVKRLFVSRLSKVYASGKAQRKITDDLGFKGTTIITKGVGVFNYVPQPPYIEKEQVRNFIYVGRFVEVKNLKHLISVFNSLPQYNLYLAGFGEQEEELKALAKENTHFLGAVNNKELPNLYQKMDVFVLPSKSEPWGLVVEEALNNGLPVIVSDRVGCAEEIIDETNGIVFKLDEPSALNAAIVRMAEPSKYNYYRKNISQMNFEEIENKQIECYL